ncbi:MAG: DUF1465 family protein [Alphaproteobacteria bacterium]|nr:DUF1465 family protein [Alphaproteobacteria bacterium]
MPATYFSRTYDEALALLIEARDYVLVAKDLDRSQQAPVQRLLHDRELLRITARMTHVMAWLLCQRAAHSGEIPTEALREPLYRLGGAPVCATNDSDALRGLAPLPRSLSQRSLDLYR